MSTPTSPNNGVLRYRSPVSGSMARIVAPFGARAAIFCAPANVAPELIPTKMPSFFASSLLHFSASAFSMRSDFADRLRCHRIPGQLGDEVRAPALHGVRFPRRVTRGSRAICVPLLLDPARQHRRFVRLAHHNLRLRPFLLKHARHALQSAACPEARDPVVEPFACKVTQNFLRRRPRVEIRVGLVLELSRVEPPVLLRQLFSLLHHAHRARRSRRDHHLRAQKAHQLAPLDAERFGHRHHQRIALGRAHHRQTDPGVSTRRLHHRLAGLQLARALRVFNHAQRQPVLHRSQRVECFDLDVEVHALGREPIDLYDRRVANRLQNVRVLVTHVDLRQAAILQACVETEVNNFADGCPRQAGSTKQPRRTHASQRTAPAPQVKGFRRRPRARHRGIARTAHATPSAPRERSPAPDMPQSSLRCRASTSPST